ncbi:HAUS augmin-like complex subunit 5 isoform X2 [Phascolarctos cinereus]|uniref:HAUS augmin-like complex subunit 5 isoform X2 n=1 Tax=Phascolarctos cinereus TaxID=38626 RepID=A0A6P5JHL3_PHACI|nr:HAUS augmin-like complex subunit 5 isoform X2 [Phascolarctos cinereus]
MDPASLAQEVGRWAAREMGCPAALLPPEPALRRMCMGPMADVWTFLTQKIHNQRTVKKIRGNLLWYSHQESPEAGRRRELEAALMRVQAEIGEMDLSLELAEREAVAQDVAQELTLKQIRDAQGKALLFRARAAAARRQHRCLKDRTQRLQGQLSHLQDVERKAKADVAFGPPTAMLLGLEPDVLQEVMRVCSLRTQFLQALLTPHSDPRTLTTQDDLFATTHRQWFSEVEVLMASHPPAHILGALEHLASRQTAELQMLTAQWDGDSQRLQLEDVSESPALPSVTSLIQEGWRAVGMLTSKRGPLLQQGQVLAERLQGLMKEVAQRVTGPQEARQALSLGLQVAALQATRNSLRAQCRSLKEEAGRRQQELWELQAKRQRIVSWRQRVEETQERIRVLIKGNSVSKSHLQKSPGEVQALVRRKVVPAVGAVGLQAQNLLGRLEEEAQWLPGLELHPLLRRHPGGPQPLPAVLPSVYSLHPACPGSQNLLHLSQDLGLPAGKAPEFLLHQAVSLRQDWLFLRDQLSHRRGMLMRLQRDLPPGPSPQELLQIQESEEKKQQQHLGPLLHRLEELMERGLDRIPQLLKAVGDWWDQPGQNALPGELQDQDGLSLQQWKLRWARAQGRRA